MVMSILDLDSLGKVRNLALWAGFRDSASGCTKPRLDRGEYNVSQDGTPTDDYFDIGSFALDRMQHA